MDEVCVPAATACLKLNANKLSKFVVDNVDNLCPASMVLFAEHVGSALSQVSQPEWLERFRRHRAQIVEVPLDKVPDDVRMISAKWLNYLSVKEVKFFVWWNLELIWHDLVGSLELSLLCESSRLVGMLFVLQMILQCKPDVLISVWPRLENLGKMGGKEEKNHLLAWAISQAHQGDPFVAEFMWVKYSYPRQELARYAFPVNLVFSKKLALKKKKKKKKKLVNGRYHMVKYKTLVASSPSPGSERSSKAFTSFCH